MVSPVIHQPWFRLYIDGTPYNISSEYTQNESLFDSITRVLQADIVDTPTLSTGQSIALETIDAKALTTVDQFSGTLNTITAARFPNEVTLTCTGPLAKLRRTRVTDLDISGQTDEQAAKTILSFCGISYLDANIAGNGYVLGQRVPIIWKAGQSGAELMAELNRVFGYALIEVGDGIVCRFPYDLAPSVADSVKLFNAGNSYYYHDGSRIRGDIDAIQNIWDITGASYECPGSTTEETCTCAIWAHAEADHPKLGAGVYTQSQTFSSEIIQDANLAQAIATRQMRWYNREPDNIVIETYNDPTMAPGRVVSIIDSVYGMDFSTETAYLVLRLDRRGDFMTLNCVGGAAGATGTVTSGVEKKCNDLSTNLPDPPDLGGFPGFDSPDFPPFPDIGSLPGFPDIPEPPGPPEPTLCTTTGDCPPGEICVDGICVPDEVHPSGCMDWFVSTSWTTPEAGAEWTFAGDTLTIKQTVLDSSFGGYLSGQTVEEGRSWTLSGKVKILQAHAQVGFGIGQNGTVFDFSGSFAGNSSMAIDTASAEVFLETDGADYSLTTGVFINFALSWDNDAESLTLIGGPTLIATKENTDILWTTPGHPIIFTRLVTGGDTGADAIVLTELNICYDDDPECSDRDDHELADCRKEANPDAVYVELNNPINELGQGDVRTDIIIGGSNDAIEVDSVGGTGLAVWRSEDPYTTWGHSFRWTFVLKCISDCSSGVCEYEVGFGEREGGSNTWYEGTKVIAGPWGEFYEVYSAGDGWNSEYDVSFNPNDWHVLTYTYNADDDVLKVKVTQDGDHIWSAVTTGGSSWGDGQDIYAGARIGCGALRIERIVFEETD
jgi:hypothetical protein